MIVSSSPSAVVFGPGIEMGIRNQDEVYLWRTRFKNMFHTRFFIHRFLDFLHRQLEFLHHRVVYIDVGYVGFHSNQQFVG